MSKSILQQNFNLLSEFERKEKFASCSYVYISHGVLVFYSDLEYIPSYHQSDLYYISDGCLKKCQKTIT